jgi:hypothetical protein
VIDLKWLKEGGGAQGRNRTTDTRIFSLRTTLKILFRRDTFRPCKVLLQKPPHR